VSTADAALVQQGYASARRVTAHHAKSFYFSSLVLFGQRRLGAFALYAFCRRVDDAIDESTDERRAETLARVREVIDALFDRGEVLDVPGFPPSELHALLDTCTRYQIPRTPFLELLAGMQMDLEQDRYRTWAQLDLYCYRVAGVVGLMMAPLLGTTDPVALRHAADLGRAMQLTNILRDVREDLGRGRVYLPQDELAACGVTEMDLRRGELTPGIRKLLTLQIDRARALYASAAQGIPWLSAFGGQRLVALMSSIYGGILDVIEARQLDVFSSRASVSLGGKVWRLLKVLFTSPTARSTPPALEAGR